MRTAAISSATLVQAAQVLAKRVGRLRFTAPVAHVYNPLDYAWAAHRTYLEQFGLPPKPILFLGMNPGPFGMIQTGVPFGEVAAVRDWLKVHAAIGQPPRVHPKRPIEGFACRRSEVSGRRLWGLFAERFGTAQKFFSNHFVLNYCPLAFLDPGGRNLTPDKLPAAQTAPLFSACDEHLRAVVAALGVKWIIGVGDFAEKRARIVLEDRAAAESPGEGYRFGRILHPSPASPAANRGWSGAATKQLIELGVWSA